MSSQRPPLPKTVQTTAPWIGAAVALLIAFVILSRFVDTLHVSIQRGHDLRAGATAAPKVDRNTADVRMADAGNRQQATSR